MNEKLDRRKKYTRMVLKDSLITLLETKQISAITVKEICEEADINRSTFYSHYHDQFDLLEQIEEELIADLNIYLNQYNFEREAEALKMTEKLLEYVVSKRDICQTLLSGNGDQSFERRVMDVARTFLIKSWIDNNEVDEDISEYASTFIISGSIYVIKHWLANDMDKSPKQMAELINSFRFRE
ncbi:TetR/AcrR family transcriptional regulator [Lentibacillus amyloliquefaciens]|uniref:TetR family transcriptional regulator n=1 Tax=Lentibacillus amyloliquefaciens TaxID=1472767 RepID=A0A0U4FUX6_9BACI|nr:TetR-like C-terminal domain-containing protein [Lentibacillus amyloliquefaciens]ALX49589.1 TetR family transcriptional regulator [Lentibacillus amyloliquefaciens]